MFAMMIKHCTLGCSLAGQKYVTLVILAISSIEILQAYHCPQLCVDAATYVGWRTQIPCGAPCLCIPSYQSTLAAIASTLLVDRHCRLAHRHAKVHHTTPHDCTFLKLVPTASWARVSLECNINSSLLALTSTVAG